MEQLDLLKQELKILQENIERIEQFQKDEANKKYNPYQSNVVGEFKHRIVALKQRLTLASKITTRDLFKK
jgi:hypothetical protein